MCDVVRFFLSRPFWILASILYVKHIIPGLAGLPGVWAEEDVTHLNSELNIGSCKCKTKHLAVRRSVKLRPCFFAVLFSFDYLLSLSGKNAIVLARMHAACL